MRRVDNDEGYLRPVGRQAADEALQRWFVAGEPQPGHGPSVPPVEETPLPEFSIARRQGAWRDALLRRMLAAADLAAALIASASLALAGENARHALWSALLAPAWLVIAKLIGLYDRDQRSLRHLTVDELPRIFTWSLIGTGTLALFLAALGSVDLSTGEAFRLVVVASGCGLVLRFGARYLWRWATPPERVVIVGQGSLAAAARRKFELFPDMHMAVSETLDELTLDGLRSRRPSLEQADRILLATSQLDEELIAELIVFCRGRQIKLSVVPPVRGMFGTAVALSHVADLPVVQFNTWDVSRSTMLMKRIVDLTVAAILLVATAPLLLLIAAMILAENGRPILFTQVRVGQHGLPFKMLKFRTMVPNAEQLLNDLVPFHELPEPMFKLARDPRVTLAGRGLRRTSLDELPQLWNVLRGDMSLVGPRPEQIELVERYSEQHRVRLWVKPGVTGPMQIYGRGRLTFEERLALEREYIENISLGRDLYILAQTVASVLHGRGAF